MSAEAYLVLLFLRSWCIGSVLHYHLSHRMTNLVLTFLQQRPSRGLDRTSSPRAIYTLGMDATRPPSHHIRGMEIKDENAPDYSGSGMAAPLQFVINNEPHLPRNREQKKLVRSHAKRQSRAVQKRRNTMPVHRRAILQKSSPQDGASESGLTLTNTSIPSLPHTPSADASFANPSSVGSDSDACFTPESSYLASEDSEARSFPTSPELHSPLPSLNSLQLDVNHFDRWMFDTSEFTFLPNLPESNNY